MMHLDLLQILSDQIPSSFDAQYTPSAHLTISAGLVSRHVAP